MTKECLAFWTKVSGNNTCMRRNFPSFRISLKTIFRCESYRCQQLNYFMRHTFHFAHKLILFILICASTFSKFHRFDNTCSAYVAYGRSQYAPVPFSIGIENKSRTKKRLNSPRNMHHLLWMKWNANETEGRMKKMRRNECRARFTTTHETMNVLRYVLEIVRHMVGCLLCSV